MIPCYQVFKSVGIDIVTITAIIDTMDLSALIDRIVALKAFCKMEIAFSSNPWIVSGS